MSDIPLLLASASPRRKALLEQLGYHPEIFPIEIDETPHPEEDPYDYVERMAREKLIAAHEELCAIGREGPYYILAGDTIGVLQGRAMVKPVDQQDFEHMMSLMSGNRHTIATSFSLGIHQGEALRVCHLEVVRTDVYFKELDEKEIVAYWETGEPQDKACGYGIQGLGAAFVSRIEGSYSSVVGLPLMEVHRALRKEGLTSRL